MAAARSLNLVFGFMAIANGPSELGMWNLVRSQIIIMPKNSAWNIIYKSTSTNMAAVRIFEIICNEFKVRRICM
jgi:hypothetical protein